MTHQSIKSHTQHVEEPAGQMTETCPVHSMHGIIEELFNKLWYEGPLSNTDAARLCRALDIYRATNCGTRPKCSASKCAFSKPGEGWVGMQGYTSLHDLLMHYQYEDGIAPVKKRRAVDAMKAPWARFPGTPR